VVLVSRSGPTYAAIFTGLDEIGFALEAYMEVAQEMGYESAEDLLLRVFDELNTTTADARRLLRRERSPRGRVTATRGINPMQPRKKKKRKSAYQAAYSKAFKRVAPNYKKKDGGWKKGGFAAAGRAARRDPAVRRAKKK
jgi:hypothetical protein